jgi:hypothetical protein
MVHVKAGKMATKKVHLLVQLLGNPTVEKWANLVKDFQDFNKQDSLHDGSELGRPVGRSVGRMVGVQDGIRDGLLVGPRLG